MAFLFKAKRQLEDEEADKRLTRFKRVHTRNQPALLSDGDINPTGTLTRTRHEHVRTMRTFAQPEKAYDMQAELHASEPISIDVLRTALPKRTAESDVKISA